ncbi:hypothetical protein EJ06DRAFT_533532 [Trichodelitschia bisporula]|uniref:DNA repair protein rad5 n=1 Tax=Trichodelitschia bisporula TaxID=703511 RepID=A0A6G1HM08_9PEZI|nr:hypothetical protein EJ06DRAFT_533532 [Trichodelitschia bisporula]
MEKVYDLEERPAKKRRFFVEDPQFDAALKKEPSVSDATAKEEPSLSDATIKEEPSLLGTTIKEEPLLLGATVKEEPSLQDEMDAVPKTAAYAERLAANRAAYEAYCPKDEEAEDRRDAEFLASLDYIDRKASLPQFDMELFASVTGVDNLPLAQRQRLWKESEQNMERAINIYLDGVSRAKSEQPASSAPRTTARDLDNGHPPDPNTSAPPRNIALRDVPSKRYVGAFGVTGWATRSGSKLAFGDTVLIERTKPAPTAYRPYMRRSTNNTIVRFTNAQGSELGRLEDDYAQWISSLLDQKVCEFSGTCIYAPERLKVNDTVHLQLRVYLCRDTFKGAALKPLESNRAVNFHESRESEEERAIRIRQVGLVKLFDEISLIPSRASMQTEKHKREALLRVAESSDKPNSSSHVSMATQTLTQGDVPSSPPEPEDGEELKQDQLDALYRKAQSFDFNTPEAEPADTFALDLRKYQKQALHWMLSKEMDEKDRHRQQSMHPLWEEYQWPTKDVDGKELPKVPGQTAFYVNPYSGELSVNFPVQDQNCLGGILADEMGLGKTIEMLSLVHTHAGRPHPAAADNHPLPRYRPDAMQAPNTTLVVAPMSLIAQWKSEAEKASKEGTLEVHLYYGNSRSPSLRDLCNKSTPSVIITSYGTVVSEYNAAASNTGSRDLMSLDFFRIILDEAHYIKNRQSKTAKACFALQGKHRWVLTGTPIVNRLEDLFSLVHFLKVEPWSNFSFWRTFITVPFESGQWIRALDVIQTVLEPLVIRRTKDMRTPDGKTLVGLPPRTINIVHLELSKAEREVYDWIFMRVRRAFGGSIDSGTILKSYTTVLAQIMRLRQTCCHPVLVRDKSIVADEEGAAAASDLASGLADDMDLEALLARFEASDNEEQDANKYGAHVLKQIQDEANNECPICAEEPMVQQAVTGCWHAACRKCLLDFIEHQRQAGKIPRCFICREPINARDVFEVIRHEYNGAEGIAIIDKPLISLRRVKCDDASTKIAGLMSHLRRLRMEDPRAKSVVFSQFTSFLDVIQPALERDRIPYVRFDGTMSQKARAAVLEDFASRPVGMVLLLSLRAGGVGLNLTAAKRVFMMDPWWSYAVEAQAIDRVHRMGQDSEVIVTRFIIRGSIEEKMLKIQDRKKFLASSLGMMSDEDKKLQRIEDIKELLS